MNRCQWCNLNNPKYIEYHDQEWGQLNIDEKYLFEMLILELFQAGLSWECILNKREAFVKAFDNFDIDLICNYDEKKVMELLQNKNIIRNKLKINATINNSKIFKQIQKEYGSFYNYLKNYTNDKNIYETGKTTNELSDKISLDLKKRGMKFVGSTIIYSYLQAIGLIYSHDEDCFMYKEKISMNNELIVNIDKLHTTINGIDRIKKNLKLNEDVVSYCKKKILDKNSYIYKQGKNWYCQIDNIIITINSYSYTIITAHTIKNGV